MAKCELCDEPRVRSERFCRTHRREMLRKMKEDGYLATIPKERVEEEAEEEKDPDDPGPEWEVTDEDAVGPSFT
jgi:hypothetical protein